MKKIILAVALALSSIAAVPAASYADTVIIRTDDGPSPHRGWDRGWDNDRRARMVSEDYRRHPSCFTQRVVTYRDGERVSRTTKVCR